MLARVRSNATRRLSCKQHNSRSEAPPPQLRSHPSPFFSRSFAVRWKRYLASSAYDIEETLGFNRPCTKPLPSSVDEYYRHIIIVRLSHNNTGVSHLDWPNDADKLDSFIGSFSSAIKSIKNSIGKVKITLSDIPPISPGTWDILVYDGRLNGTKVTGLTSSSLYDVTDYLLSGKPGNLNISTVPYKASESFKERLSSLNITDVLVAPTSHVGGHDYAGNVLIFPRGVWYGYVKPADVDTLIQKTIINNEVVNSLCRGHMGMSSDDQKRLISGSSSTSS